MNEQQETRVEISPTNAIVNLVAKALARIDNPENEKREVNVNGGLQFITWESLRGKAIVASVIHSSFVDYNLITCSLEMQYSVYVKSPTIDYYIVCKAIAKEINSAEESYTYEGHDYAIWVNTGNLKKTDTGDVFEILVNVN